MASRRDKRGEIILWVACILLLPGLLASDVYDVRGRP